MKYVKCLEQQIIQNEKRIEKLIAERALEGETIIYDPTLIIPFCVSDYL